MAKRHRIHAEKVYVIRVNIWHRWYKRLALLAFIVALPLAAYFGTDWYLGETQRELETENGILIGQVTGLRSEITDLEQANANLLMSAQMDAGAELQLQNELVLWRERNEILQSEIQFYLSLMEPSTNSQGIFVQSAELTALDEPNAYRYSLIVGQKSQNHPRVAGDLRIELISENQGQYSTLGLADLSDEGEELSLGFRFFQQIEGVIYLPTDFEPDQWVVQIDLASSNSGSIIETYNWPFLTGVEE